MYTFLALQPHNKKQNQVQKEKRNGIITTEMYVTVHSESLGSNKRPYIEEENKMCCVRCRKAADVDNSIEQKCVYSWD